jgi:hypothetical protein
LTRLFLAAIVSAVLASAQPAQVSAVSGRVADLAGQPLRKVALTLRPNGAAVPQPTPLYIAASDAQGKYSFDAVEPGSYMLSAERAGYLQKFYRATPRETMSRITIGAGQRISDINIAMARAIAVSGKVLDAEGDPVAGVQVSLLRRMANNGAEFAVQRSVSTDPSGRYELLDLAAGQYYLSARGSGYDAAFPIEGMRAVNYSQAGLRTNPGHPFDYYATTYYPGETDRKAAQPIRIATGQSEVAGIDIRLRKTPAFLVKGKIAGTPQGHPLEQCQIVLSHVGVPSAMGGNIGYEGATARIAKDGSFEFQDTRFPPGSYVLTAIWSQGRSLVLARQNVAIINHDIDDAVLTFQPLLEVRGILAIEDQTQTDFGAYPGGNPPPTIITQVSLQALTVTAVPNSPSTRIQRDGSFNIADVAQGTYNVRVYGVPSGTYVKSIRLDGREVTNAGAEITAATAASLRIMLSRAVGRASGTIRTDDGKPAVNCSVTLMSDPYQAGGTSMLTGSDDTGHFTTPPLAPGTYRVYGFEYLEMAQRYDPDFLAQFENRSVRITVKENSEEQVTLRLIPPAPL